MPLTRVSTMKVAVRQWIGKELDLTMIPVDSSYGSIWEWEQFQSARQGQGQGQGHGVWTKSNSLWLGKEFDPGQRKLSHCDPPRQQLPTVTCHLPREKREASVKLS